MKSSLAPGISYCLQTQVNSRHLVPALFPDSPPIAAMPRVLATAWLVALMEHACILALEPHLDAGEASVGISIDLKHFAPTPEAIRIAIEVECIEVEKRRSVWSIVARDEIDEIGRARHERMVVNSDRFADALATKEKLLAQART
ncbi:MAG TPA: thioesterase family protein [Xanthobacteraceae bacterium]|nr:thioesterase family protein [Xanthobacteraceae bacterium]